jgi:Flp pilus assembly pilin Flp
MVEYGLVLLFVAVALIVSLVAMNTPLQDLFGAIVNGFPAAG